MIEVGPPPKQPLPSGGAAVLPAKPGAAAIPVQLVQPAALPVALPASGTLPALVEPGSQAGILGDLLQLSTDQGPLTIQSPVMLAAGTRVTLQLATIAGRAQLFLIPPRPSAEAPSPPGKAAIIADAAKPGLATLVPGRAVIATVVRAAPRSGEAAPPVAATADAAESAATPSEPGAAAAPAASATAAALAALAAEEPAAPTASTTMAAPATLAAAAKPAPALAPPTAAAAQPDSAPAAAPAEIAAPAAPSAPVAAGQAFAGMATGQQLTLTVLSVTPNAAAGARAPGAAEPAAPASAPATAGSATPAAAQSTPSQRGAAPPPLPVPQANEALPEPATAAKPLATTPPPPQSPVTETQAPPSTAPTAAPAAVIPPPPVASSIATPAAALSADAITVAANVVGSDAAGQPILAAGSVLLVLEAKAPPVGSEILLALPRGPGETAPPPNAASVFAPLEEVARQAAVQSGALQQAINTLLPRPGPALAAQLALYVGALRQGSAASWLGTAALDQLDKIGKGRTSQRLTASFAEAARANAGADRAAGWLSLTLPVANAGLIQPIQLYIQRRRDEEEKDERPESEQGRRFLIDFTLTRLGGIQLDGLARAGRLDLIVRTGLPMATELRGDLDRLFADVTSARGLSGALIFQVAPPVAPIPRALPQQPVGGILV